MSQPANLTIEIAGETYPAKYEVCQTCHGRGKCMPEAMRTHAYSQEDFEQDPELRDQMLSGGYDKTCYACKGERVVLVENWSYMTTKQRRTLNATKRSLDDVDRMMESERRNGA
jgi:hypothetical protein